MERGIPCSNAALFVLVNTCTPDLSVVSIQYSPQYDVPLTLDITCLPASMELCSVA